MSGLFCGVSIGIVTNIKDPDGLARVKLRLPWLSDDLETDWARVAVPMAGGGRGFYFLPEVDDEVLVAFEHGDPNRPFVVGALWNGVDKPPETNQDGKNDVRVIKSRSGHLIRLTDTSGSEKIEIIDKSGDNQLVVNTAERSVTITAAADITIEAKDGTLSLKGKAVKIATTSGDLTLDGAGKVAVTSNTELKLKGSIVNIN